VKCWGQIFVRNTIIHHVTKEALSAPPPESDYAQWNVPPVLREDVHWALRSLYGDETARPLKMEDHRICWLVFYVVILSSWLTQFCSREAWTPTEDFIISPHSACAGLYVATCGSFHGFKFLPVIGKYVVQMLEGKLEPELQERWAWDRERPAMEDEDHWARRELKDFLVEESVC
jgi:hypothetical protein